MSRVIESPGRKRTRAENRGRAEADTRPGDSVECLARSHRHEEGWADVPLAELSPDWRRRYAEEALIAVRSCQDTALEAAYQRATRRAVDALDFGDDELEDPRLMERTDHLVRSVISAFRESLAEARSAVDQLLEEAPDGAGDETLEVRLTRRARVQPIRTTDASNSRPGRRTSRSSTGLRAPGREPSA